VSALPSVCVLAGGLGTRLGERTREMPKALMEVAGEPFLWHQLRLLALHGASEVVLCVGHLGEMIQASVGSERFGLRIAYSFDAPQLDGTLGAIRRARGLLGERFLVLYGDTYLRLDYAAAVAAWEASGLPAMMTVLRNEGRWEPSNASYAEGRVVCYDKRAEHPGMRWIDYGLGGLDQSSLDRVPPSTRELPDLLALLAGAGMLFGYEATERFFEIGTPAALAETDTFLRSRVAVSHASDEMKSDNARGGEAMGAAR
jgi:N-acetyl-alpha-D-muramate 1-phosphate uridylyltransferase